MRLSSRPSAPACGYAYARLRRRKKKWSGPLQYEDKSGQLMMLPTDMALLWVRRRPDNDTDTDTDRTTLTSLASLTPPPPRTHMHAHIFTSLASLNLFPWFQDRKFKPWVELYAKDEEVFFKVCFGFGREGGREEGKKERKLQ